LDAVKYLADQRYRPFFTTVFLGALWRRWGVAEKNMELPFLATLLRHGKES
jgi:hypothetical protein